MSGASMVAGPTIQQQNSPHEQRNVQCCMANNQPDEAQHQVVSQGGHCTCVWSMTASWSLMEPLRLWKSHCGTLEMRAKPLGGFCDTNLKKERVTPGEMGVKYIAKMSTRPLPYSYTYLQAGIRLGLRLSVSSMTHGSAQLLHEGE